MRRWPGLFLLFLGCQPPHSPLMNPGDDCLSCHVAGQNSHVWTVAGTVFQGPLADAGQGRVGVEVLVTDANGRQLTLHTNSAGNFYTAEALAFPVEVLVQDRLSGARGAMDDHPKVGNCNSCHNDPPDQGAIGRLFVPEL